MTSAIVASTARANSSTVNPARARSERTSDNRRARNAAPSKPRTPSARVISRSVSAHSGPRNTGAGWPG